jgi:ATP-dependent protease ClpP protease subunit
MKRQRYSENCNDDCLNYRSVETNEVNCYRVKNVITFCDQIAWHTVLKLNMLLKDAEKEILDEIELAKKDIVLTKYPSINIDISAKPIILVITTYGGLVASAWSTVDCIQNLSVPVHSVIRGYVASAGTIITMSTSKRFIEQNAYMLIHELSSGVWGKYVDLQNEFDNLKKYMKHIIRLYMSRSTKFTKQELKTLLRKDSSLTSQEAVAKELVDSIVDVTNKPNQIKWKEINSNP